MLKVELWNCDLCYTDDGAAHDAIDSIAEMVADSPNANTDANTDPEEQHYCPQAMLASLPPPGQHF
ncbi:hypothetical protein T492DRAFT_910825 [Pavlovales sp. CCMP2436]|nr:hypothetical protein T492DRAFT_910825 [Pavlovales sp. CCMP2436]